jgi:hypothetical protein
MRNAKTQRSDIMVYGCVSQQLLAPHVSHAEIGGL